MPNFIQTRTRSQLFAFGIVSVFIVGTLSLSFGAVHISFFDTVSALFGKGEQQTLLIVQKLRLPRIILAASVGALLATSGAMTQGLFRNPLADPSLIGISSGAMAGASIAIVFLQNVEFGIGFLSVVSLAAMLGGALCVWLVYRVASNENGTSVATMLLAGIGITFIAASISSVLEFVASNEMLRQISLWRMGGFDSATFERSSLVIIVLLIILVIAPRFYSALNAFLLGESEAHHLGFKVEKIKILIVAMVAASVGVSVAMAGTITFLGLVVPHIVRILIGADHRVLVPLSAVFGALLLIVADTFARTIIAPSELPVGLVTTFMGAPIFIYLLRSRQHYGSL